jgi:hypothetical protein
MLCPPVYKAKDVCGPVGVGTGVGGGNNGVGGVGVGVESGPEASTGAVVPAANKHTTNRLMITKWIIRYGKRNFGVVIGHLPAYLTIIGMMTGYTSPIILKSIMGGKIQITFPVA